MNLELNIKSIFLEFEDVAARLDDLGFVPVEYGDDVVTTQTKIMLMIETLANRVSKLETK